jgi:hypothetical protein
MALTLAEASKLSNDALLQGVIETIIYDNDVLKYLPFIEIVGNGLTYNRENAEATVGYYDVGDTWEEDTPDFTQVTAVLKICGGDADVDNFLAATRSNIQDLEAAVLLLKAKALSNTFGMNFIYGDSSTNSKQPDGIRKLIGTESAHSQLLAMGATGATLTIDKLDHLIDLAKGGPPDLLLMSKRSRRKIKSLARAAGNNLEIGTGRLGLPVEYYGTIPIGISDHILDTHTCAGSVETATTGGACSTIYAFRFGEGALVGLTSPGGLQIERVGQLETKDATRNRVKFYHALALFNTVSCAALIGVKD